MSERDALGIRASLKVGAPVVVEIEYRGFTPAGELRHAVIKGWHASA